MEISNHGAGQGSWYVNPNTRTLTSNRKNTEIKDRDAFGCMQHLLNPVEDMVKALTTPINLADRNTVNRASNTISIAAGTQIAVNDGYILTVTERGVECHHGKNYDPYDVEAYKRAQGFADSLAVLLRNARGTQQAAAFSREEYQKWTENVSGVLSYMGLDNSRDFILNGMKYHKNAAGCWESASNSSAKAVYEQQQANNRTFTYADERTRKQIDYISNYYLEHTSVQMRAAWQKAMEETGINPFPEGFSSTLSQLAMEQDFAAGGNDDIFGADAGSNIAAVRNILDRINDPLGEIPEKDRSFRADEKVFYERVLEHLTEAEGSTAATTGEKRPYTAYESANYRIEPDNENECFTIYNGQGERLGVFFYSDIKCRQDDASGKEFLISENGTMWYDVLVLDPELKDDLKHVMGVDTLKTEPLQGYTLKTHAGTGIQYIMKDGDEGRGGRVLLQSDADRAKYEELAETYFNKYPNLIKSKDEAYIWASFEITGMVVRTENGIISLHYDNVSYNDDTNVRNNWSIRFQDDVYKQIFEWLEKNQDQRDEMQKFSFWQEIFGEIGGSYERVSFDTKEAQTTKAVSGAEEKTKHSTALKTAEYYAEKAFASVGANAPEKVKRAWMEAAKETSVNGLGIASNGMMIHISQMMVQRLQKSWTNGGTVSNDILGNSVSSAIYAAKQALYDLENPLVPESTRSIEVQRQRVKEKAFYEAFIQKLEEISGVL